MTLSRWGLRLAAVAASGLTAVATLPAGSAVAQTGAIKPVATTGSAVKLTVAQNYITVPRFGKQVFLDPGVYIEALGSQLEFRVQRASYSKPLTLTQVIHLPGGGTELRPLPAWLLDGWNGVRRFLRITITNSHGKNVASRVIGFCPNSFNPQRAAPGSPPTSPFPQQCSSDPFEQGMMLGIQRGWGVDPYGGYGFGFGSGSSYRLKLGTYHATVKITRVWAGLLHVSAADAVAHVKFKVVNGNGCKFGCPPSHRHGKAGTLPTLPKVPTLASPPVSVRPDLSPLPSWGISLQRSGGKKKPVSYQLQFGATVWIGGNSPLDVEGFRVHGSPTMQAYQYFWHNGHLVGRARVGTMGFSGYNHWHFQQFARYRLLSASKSVVLRSHKEGFCIAPTDPVNLLVRHATWVPSFTGLSGACGSPTALWVQELLQVGWGDTYFQSVPGESFNITNLPNGTYYIEIIANPEGLLYETNTSNDISLRKVILGGTPDHRTVKVPAYHGIDPEQIK